MYAAISLPNFDSLPYQSALLDSNGIIVAVNDAWRAFAEDNGASPQLREGVGLDYLATCRNARGDRSHEAPFAITAIERGLAGLQPRSTFQYPCHSPSKDRWFLYTGTATDIYKPNKCVFVSHVEFSDSHQPLLPDGSSPLAGFSLDDGMQEARQDRNAAVSSEAVGRQGKMQEPLVYKHLQRQTATGCWALDRSLTTLQWTPECHRIYGTSPTTFPVTFETMLKFYSPKNQTLLGSLFLRLAHSGESFDVELPAFTIAKSGLWIRMTGRAEIHGARVRQLYGTIQDLTACRDLQRRLARAERKHRFK